MNDGPEQPIEMKWFQEQGKHDPIHLYCCSFHGTVCFCSRRLFVLFHFVSVGFVVPSVFCSVLCVCVCVNVYSFSFEMLMHYITLHYILYIACCQFMRPKTARTLPCSYAERVCSNDLFYIFILFHFCLRSPNTAYKFSGTFYHIDVYTHVYGCVMCIYYTSHSLYLYSIVYITC